MTIVNSTLKVNGFFPLYFEAACYEDEQKWHGLN